jgi:hypothetical protein
MHTYPSQIISIYHYQKWVQAVKKQEDMNSLLAAGWVQRFLYRAVLACRMRGTPGLKAA